MKLRFLFILSNIHQEWNEFSLKFIAPEIKESLRKKMDVENGPREFSFTSRIQLNILYLA